MVLKIAAECKLSTVWHHLRALQCKPTGYPLASMVFSGLVLPWTQSIAALHHRLPNTHHRFTNIHLSTLSTNVAIQPFGVGNLCKTQEGESSVAVLSDLDEVCRIISENLDAGNDMESALEKCGVQMSTELVDKILERFRFQEKVAFRFFTWASHQNGYRHESHTFNEMIDILSSTKFKSKQFAIICDLLKLMKRSSNSRLPIEAFAKVLRDYTEKHLITLRKFANKKKGKIKANPEVNALNMLLDALCKCYLVSEAQALFDKLRIKFKPDDKTYSVLFFGWCTVRKPYKAMEILNEMIDVGHDPDNFTYNTLLDALSTDGHVGEALKFFNFMKEKGCAQSVPTAKTYSILIVAFSQLGRIEEALGLLSEMRDSGCLPDVPTYTEMIEGFCSAGKLEEAFKLLDEMRDKGYPPDIVTYNCFMKVLCNLKNVNEALRLFDRIKDVGCLPSIHTYNMLIKMFCEMGQLHMAFDLFHDMNKPGVCSPDAFTYCTLIKGLLENGEIEEACSCLKDAVWNNMRLPYHAYDNFLMELSKAGDLRRIQWLSGYMRHFYHHRQSRRFHKAQRWRKGGDKG
ncbi:pentatricopeptide repeat-containing protein At1g73400, mitochondrial [Cryptomeria japonica]|uniref:pentatricopeptide repeat-containing protein At1g73400, mitochondrial n=1 Tax=Cryptomeria japonica TaxID=3369 RepID=UPI0027DA7E71|nr:pentatricopeptide repeat-containing protein At1g73400, mitochondrial [Cryptomeria japonica]